MRAIPNTSSLMLVLIGLVICFYGLTNLKTNADYRVYFDKDDPLLQVEQVLAEQYAEMDSLILILSTGQNTLLEPTLVDAYAEFEQALANINYVQRITGFFQFLGEDVSFEEAFSDAEPTQDATTVLQRLRSNAAGKNFITADGRYGLLNIGVSLPGENAAKEVKQFMVAVDTVIDKQPWLKEYSVTINYSGPLALNEAYIDVVRHDLKRFIPLLFLLFSICLFVFFRNLPITFLLIGIALFSALAAFGIAGWMQWELAAINAFTPIIIMSLNVATSMHIVINYFRFVAEGSSRVDAMTESVCYNFQALTFSKLTTAFGFLLLSFSPSPPVQIVGYIVAIGMLISYVLCLTLLRFLLPKLSLTSENAKLAVQRFSLDKLGVSTLKQGRHLLIFSAAVLLASLVALQQLNINDNVYEYFPEEHRFRQGTQLIDNQFDGAIRLLYSIDSGKGFGVLETEYTERLTAFTSWLREQPLVERVDDVLTAALDKKVKIDSVKPILETNSPELLGLERELTENYKAVKISVFLNTLTASELIAFDKKVNDWLNNNMGRYVYSGGVGPDILFARLGERNAKSMFFSLGLALIVIGLLAGLLLRSWSAMMLGLMCNLFPVIIVFSVWALIGGYISLGSAMVMGMIMGIIVDDTLHMLLKYPRAQAGMIKEAILTLYEKVCPAIMVTSITLAMGLFVGVFSGFRPIFELSLLSLSIILVAMLANLLLLPALMQSMKFSRV